MKKTLIALVALAGGAMAVEEALTLTSPTGGTLESSNKDIAWSEAYTSLESWELSFDLKDAAYPTSENALIFGTRQDSGAAGYTLGVTSSGAVELGYRYTTPAGNGTYTYHYESLKTSGNSIVTTGVNFGITLKFVADVTADGTLKGGTFTLTCGGESHVYTLPQGTAENRLTYTALENGSNARFWTNGAAEKFYNISVTKQDSNFVAPEPTTATLSLLALAGLAARRRRR